MVYAGGAAGGAAAAYHAMVQATKASGVLVRVEPEGFLRILEKTREPLVVTARGGVFKANHQYLTSYKGLAFHTKSSTPLMLPGGTEVVAAKEIWIPS